MFFPSKPTLPGVSQSLWEYAHDPAISRDDDAHLAGSPLLDFDRQLVMRWFAGSEGASVSRDVRLGGAAHPTRRLIDLGCGTGRLLLPLARAGFDATGVDLSAESLRLIASRAAKSDVKVGLIRANLCELDCIPDGSFDVALLMFGTLGMIEGATNRLAALRHARRILKPGGRLALHVHNVWSHAFHPHGRWWLLGDRLKWLLGSKTAGDTHRDYRGIPRMYHHAFTSGELQRLLNAAGFAVEDVVSLRVTANGRIISPCAFDRFRATGWIIRARAVSFAGTNTQA